MAEFGKKVDLTHNVDVFFFSLVLTDFILQPTTKIVLLWQIPDTSQQN